MTLDRLPIMTGHHVMEKQATVLEAHVLMPHVKISSNRSRGNKREEYFQNFNCSCVHAVNK